MDGGAGAGEHGDHGRALAVGWPASEVVDTVRPVCWRLAPHEQELVVQVRQSMAQLAPQLRAEGRERDIVAGIVAEIVRCLLWAVLSEEPREVVAGHLYALGYRHALAGFPPAGYQDVGQALLRALRLHYRDGCDSRTTSALVAVYLWLAGHFAEGAVVGRREVEAELAAMQRFAAPGTGVRPEGRTAAGPLGPLLGADGMGVEDQVRAAEDAHRSGAGDGAAKESVANLRHLLDGHGGVFLP